MISIYSERCQHSQCVRSVVLVVLLFCAGFRATAGDGFLGWDKTEMWSLDCLIRGVEWVDGYGWFGVGMGDFEDGDSGRGLVLHFDTDASVWSENLLEWGGRDAGSRVSRAGPVVGVGSHGNVLAIAGPDAAYSRNLDTGVWTRSTSGTVDYGNGPEPNYRFCWGGGVVWGNDRFVMTDTLGLEWSGTYVFTSLGASDWTRVSFASPALPANAIGQWDCPPGFAICYSGSRYVAVTSCGWIITSADGDNWQTGRQARAEFHLLRGVAAKDGVFVAVGDAGTVLRSTNGTTWDRCDIPTNVDLKAIAASELWFMAVGAAETVLISHDGTTWRSIGVPSGEALPVIYTAVGSGNDRFMVATDDGNSLLSGVEPLPVVINVSPPGAGSVASVTHRGVLAVNAGEALDVTAVATFGYRFEGWAGDVTQEDARLLTTVNAPLTLTANFMAATPLQVSLREGPSLGEPRMGHRMVTLAAGTPVAVGGHTTGHTRSETMAVGTPTIESFSLAEAPGTADGAAVAKLLDGQFLIAGGAGGSLGLVPGVNTAMLLSSGATRGTTIEELPVTMVRPRMNCGAGRLDDGQVLIAGGWFDAESATYGELFNPGVERDAASFVETGALNTPRSHPLVIPTTDGGAVVAGGLDVSGANVTRLEAYNVHTNTFSILAETPLDDGEPWILNTQLPGDIRRQQRSDGSYVFWAWHAKTLAGAILLFDPATRSFSKVVPYPALGETSSQAFMPVVDTTETQALVLVGNYDEAQAETRFLVHMVDLSTGKCRSMTSPVTVAGYFPVGASVTGFVATGTTRLLVAGGCSQLGTEPNWHPVSRTLIFDPMLLDELGTGDTTCVATDFQGIKGTGDNVHMVRDTAGALYVSYTRAVRPPGESAWFAFARRRNAAGSWRREIRTEGFPNSSAANSIVIDGAGRIHQGLTFNVGAFHTVTAFGDGRPSSVEQADLPWDSGPSRDVWGLPTPLWDGGWHDYDYDAKLAMRGDRLFAVSTRAYGWADFPLNLMLREWHDDTGWGTPALLTALPNEDAAGFGVQGHRFQVRPDGRGVVLYADHPSTGPQEVKLLEVGLPSGSTVTTAVSAAGRWGRIGDVAVAGDGVSHVAWMEADAEDGVYELWYATHHTLTGLSTPVLISSPDEPSVLEATVGLYGGGRVLVAYGVAGSGRPYGGVYLRKIAGEVSEPVRVGATNDAHSPALRSTWDMPHPNAIDLMWVEVYSWGSLLLHQELDWNALGVTATAAVTIQSNEQTATFTLDGPFSGVFTMVGGEWSGPALPAGSYTITWHAVDGRSAPPVQGFAVTGDAEVTVGASYIDAGLHRVIFSATPAGAGTIESTPPGVELLGGHRSYGDGEVTFRPRPAEGQVLVGWQLTSSLGTVSPTDSPLTVTIDRDYEVLAKFEPGGPFRVDTMLSGSGTITPGTIVAAGSRFVCTIAPAADQQLAEVLLDGVSQGLGPNVVVDPVSGPHSIQAFTEPAAAEVTTTWLPEMGGTVVVSPATYALGDTVEVEARPATDYRFVEWRGAATGTNATIHVYVGRAKSVTAIFAANRVILGDLNNDGAISIEDAVLARRMYAGLEPVDLVHGDMDGDGDLDTADVAAILQAEARGDRPCLGGQDVVPGEEKRLVSFANGIDLTMPAGWPDTARRASVALGLAGELPDLPPSLERVTPIYDIRLSSTGAFGREIGFAIPLPASARRRADDQLRLLHLDPESNAWVTVPTLADGGSRAGKVYGSGESSGKYTVAKVSEIKDAVEGTHCVVYYDPAVTHRLADTMPAADFAAVVAAGFDFSYDAYQATNYDLPAYEKSSVDLFVTSMDLDRRADVYLSDVSNTYKEPFYSWKTKNYYIPSHFDDAEDARFNMAHELFHAIQNRTFSGPSMAVNRWLFEMIAEYASRKAPYNVELSTKYGAYLGTPLGSLDDIHEYACAHLLHYLLRASGGTFRGLWDGTLAPSQTPWTALDDYAKDQAGRSLNRLYAEYVGALQFDSATANLVVPEPEMPANGTPWGTDDEIENVITIPAARSAGWMSTALPSFANYPTRVLVELPDGVPDQVNAKVYQAPWAKEKIAGGRKPLGSFFVDETLPFAVPRLETRDCIYVMAYRYSGFGSRSVPVRMRPMVVNVTQDPDPLVAYAPCTFVATVSPIPDCAEQLEVYWKLSDGTPWQKDTVSVDTPDFTLEHTFAAEKDETFQVTFEMYCLDADGRRRLLVKQTRDVAVEACPTIVLVPNVVQVEVEQEATLVAEVQNPPDTPEYQWTFGDESAPVTTSDPTASHTYDAADNYEVTVALVDAAEPTVVLAQAVGRVVVLDPVQTVDDPPGGEDPAAPMLDYTKLRRVDETRPWDGVREVYFVDSAGRKHGLYQSFLVTGETSRPLDAVMYIHGYREGKMQVHMQVYVPNGPEKIETEYRNFHLGIWNGTGASVRTVTMMMRWGSRDGDRGTSVALFSSGSNKVVPMLWPAAVAGKDCVIHYGPGAVFFDCGDADNMYETVSFDALGRRHGLCTLQYDAGGETRTIATGTFNAGVKTGIWKYFEWNGDSGTGVSYDHSRDPPNQQ